MSENTTVITGEANSESRKKIIVNKTASESTKKMTRQKRAVVQQESYSERAQPLTENEVKARMYKRYSTTTFGFNSRKAYSGGGGADVSGSTQGSFYSPQLSTDFLEKPQNLRERRAWYRTFYNSNEFVGQAVDLHSTLPISKIKLDKPKSENQDYADYVYDFFVEMCNDVKLTKTLLEISHEYNLMGNCVPGSALIRTPKAYVKAEDIKVDDLVFTSNNRWRPILKTVSRRAESLLKITTEGFGELIVSEEHPLEIIIIDLVSQDESKTVFICAKEVKEGYSLRVLVPEEPCPISNESLKTLEDTARDIYIKNDTDYGVAKLLGAKIIKIEKIAGEVVFNFEVEEDHTYQVNGFSTHNCFIFCEDHDPYSKEDAIGKEVLKEQGRLKTKELYEKFKVVDKDPNYRGFRKLLILPPDQVRVKKIPLSDDSLIEFVPDPETKKTIMGMIEGSPLSYDYRISDTDKQKIQADLPEVLFEKLKEGGAIPLDTDPYSGSHCFHLSRKKSQYETMGTSILERCVNTLLYQDKLRQSQTSIASKHMTPVRIVWAEGMSDTDTDSLREQVDIALVDPDFSIITNFEVHWEEMGSNGRLLELSTEFEHIENSLFAGLGVTREILTGEGTYSGNRINLEILNTQYLLFREQLQEFVENNLFKPVAKKKGFEEEDKFGRKRLLYPHLSFSRLAVRDNDAFFDQAFNMFNKGSLSVDIIHDMMNIDTHSTKKKLEADLFTVNDANFNQLLQNLYTSLGTILAEKYDVGDKVANYLGLNPVPEPAGEAGGEVGGGGLPGMGRFSSNLSKDKQAALMKIMQAALKNPDKLEQISKFLNGKK